jgi:serine/threonine protein kinase
MTAEISAERLDGEQDTSLRRRVPCRPPFASPRTESQVSFLQEGMVAPLTLACMQTYTFWESGADSTASHPCKERKGRAPPAFGVSTMASFNPKGWAIVEQLPEGGQGWLYLVKRSDRSDSDLYVLKRFKNKNRLARFESEVAALQKLSHAGILKIVEASIDGNDPFYVAEHCEKGDLTKQDLSRKSLLEKLFLYREICDAIAAAHQAKVIHRDLKPQNVLVRKDGSLAVGDFGLCLDLSGNDERDTSIVEAVGPRHYMAPELEDGRVDNPEPSSDCYSLGKLLYFILSGRSFSREKHREASYDLRSLHCEQGMHFVYELLDKTIQVEPTARFRNGKELLEALNGVIMRAETNAHVLNINVPQHCLYCITGLYQLRPDWGHSVDDMAVVCNTCGNIQRFTAQNSPQKKWWKS